jgi:MFS family permease
MFGHTEVDPETGGSLLRLVAVASITVSFLAASSAPTPLYATYQAAWGFSALTTTVVFGVYAIAFLAALLTAGRLSDHIGRRPVLLAGIAGNVLALPSWSTLSVATPSPRASSRARRQADNQRPRGHA